LLVENQKSILQNFRRAKKSTPKIRKIRLKTKKILRASRVRLDLPQISIENDISFFQDEISNKLYQRFSWDPEFQKFEYAELLLDPKLLNKSATRFILRINYPGKTQN
jgi:hypothetical protein